jgi:hypothetical protein
VEINTKATLDGMAKNQRLDMDPAGKIGLPDPDPYFFYHNKLKTFNLLMFN